MGLEGWGDLKIDFKIETVKIEAESTISDNRFCFSGQPQVKRFRADHFENTWHPDSSESA